jgi:hypothetical protein
MSMPVRSMVHVFERARIYPSSYPIISETERMPLYNCTADVTIGSLVRLKPDDGTMVETASASEIYSVLGVVTTKPSSTKANVQVFGTVTGLIQNLVPGTDYFLGLGGKVMAPPLNPRIAPFVQRVGLAVAPDALYLTLTGPSVHRAKA